MTGTLVGHVQIALFCWNEPSFTIWIWGPSSPSLLSGRELSGEERQVSLEPWAEPGLTSSFIFSVVSGSALLVPHMVAYPFSLGQQGDNEQVKKMEGPRGSFLTPSGQGGLCPSGTAPLITTIIPLNAGQSDTCPLMNSVQPQCLSSGDNDRQDTGPLLISQGPTDGGDRLH